MYQDELTPPARSRTPRSTKKDLPGVAILVLVMALITFATGVGLIAGYLIT